MKLFVAADEGGEKYLYWSVSSIEKDIIHGIWAIPEDGRGAYMRIDDSLFPECKWEDTQPLELEISINRNKKEEESKVDEFEYNVVNVSDKCISELKSKLNDFGKDGWELVSFIPDWGSRISLLIFKRKKNHDTGRKV